LACGQYMIAPTPGVNGSGTPNPGKAPDVINNSWGSTLPGDSNQWYRQMVTNWRAAGIFPVFAAGNDGEYGEGSISTPGNYPESFAVAAVDSSNNLASFSSRGPAPLYSQPSNHKPDISAPGVNIRSAMSWTPDRSRGYYNMSGTSMAAPHVAGVVALLLQYDPWLTVSEIETILRDNATPLTGSGYSSQPNFGFGYGLVNAVSSIGDFSYTHSLYWQNVSTGQRVKWNNDFIHLISSSSLSPSVVSTDWKIAAIADMNDNGNPDLVWEHNSSGRRVIWFMDSDGVTQSSSMSLNPDTVATSWKIAAAADMDGDGFPDLIWENTSSGRRVVWFMEDDGYTLKKSKSIEPGTVATAWSIAAAADMNNNGITDLVWQNSSSGSRVIWFMGNDGLTLDSSTALNPSPVNTVWKIVAARDVDGDGQADLIYENTVSGERVVWFMEEGGINLDRSLHLNPSPVNSNWRIAGAYSDTYRGFDYTIKVQSNPRNAGRVSGSGGYNAGSTATLKAEPYTGYFLSYWSVKGSTDSLGAAPTLSRTVNENQTYTANFGLIEHGINISPNNESFGTVSGGGLYYHFDTAALQVKANRGYYFVNSKANRGYYFVNWLEDGNIVSTSPDYTFEIDSTRTLVAQFAPYNSIIYWQHSTTGHRVAWFMEGTERKSSSSLEPGTVTPAWQIAATADMNGNGTADLIWQHNSTGRRVVWFMEEDGLTLERSESLEPGIVSPAWQIAAAADMNADGTTELIWQHTTSGHRVVWFMEEDGVTLQTSKSLEPGTVAPQWQIAAAADLNGDSRTELIWQHSSSGRRVVWFMAEDGVTLERSEPLGPGTVAPAWQIAAAADINSNGRAELIWQHTSTGRRVVWFMEPDGITLEASESLEPGTVIPQWQIAGAANKPLP